MPWLETSPMDERWRFIEACRAGYYDMTERCTRYSVSRTTGYKWLERFEEEGKRGLADRSRAPHHCPHKISREVARVLCAARRKHMDWGPEKTPRRGARFPGEDDTMPGPTNPAVNATTPTSRAERMTRREDRDVVPSSLLGFTSAPVRQGRAKNYIEE